MESNDPLQRHQETILGTHFSRDKEGSGNGNDYDVEYVDSLLAKEFTNLTVQERSKTYEELHGVSDCIEETPTLVETCLSQLDEELSRVTEKSAYNMAEQQNRAYVTDSKFRLMFLRATNFDPKKAAIRLVAFFEGKLRFFGQETLTRQIRFNDLDRDDQACHMQILPCRDRSGRPIITDVNTLRDRSYKIPTNRLRAYIYLWLMVAEEEENQKRGVVVIAIQMGAIELSKLGPELLREFPRLDKWLPIRSSAIHLCTDHPITSFLWRTAVIGASSETRVRHRLHVGTYTEIMYALLGYGIPVDVIPIGESGVIKKTNLNRWISKHISKEKAMIDTELFAGIDLPSQNDVLTGKGKPIQQHPGNVYLRNLVEYFMEDFKDDKLKTSERVCTMIKENAGRFLNQSDDGWWWDVTETGGVDKVMTTFLTLRTKQNKESCRVGGGGASTSPIMTTSDSETTVFLHQGKKPRYESSSFCWN